MKNTLKFLGIIAFAAIIGFSAAACKDDAAKDALDNTTWKATYVDTGVTMDLILKFNSPNFTMSVSFAGQTIPSNSGTYSVSGSRVTLTITAEGETSTVIGTLSGNRLTIEDMVFTKQ
jgi:hypothetical protein